ncbi:MAG: hypothetical protein J5825_05880 [Lachnospiraceae bacterium]|nr:hypothetical protein [Lachnospiraceae bacterium]
MFFKKKEARELEKMIKNIQSNLENNYKDMAKSFLKDAQELLERCKNEKILNEKELKHYSEMIDGYEMKMKGYEHTDISKFLHDRM